MGKETKIGIAVLAILLIVFGVVLVKKLTRPADDTLAAADEREQSATPGKSAASDNDSKPTSVTLTAGKPTVLSPAKLPGDVAHHPPEDVTSQWITATDPPKKNSSGDAAAASDLPAQGIPSPPSSSSSGSPSSPAADASYAMSSDLRQTSSSPPPSSTSSTTPEGRADAPALAPAKENADPFRAHSDRTAPAASSGYASAGQGTGTTRRVEPSPTYSQTPPDSYSAASSPIYADTSRDPYSAASPPPLPAADIPAVLRGRPMRTIMA